ncbi:hypothetical protein AKJ61_03915 [candidate division MSBL1 archaeon SCGC-AAA259B11]|uniref:SF3 helicase domain-containing protein n=1 Tax=candidate division MSBL1 archaeon SCGC-AAA259B11 TaxID=1698260 RepID=A0A133U444_9EURY|nr:hypothetical protein AKJ61_03915 [candidate division MSBL1 archaeon SCGC-AAA259B11]
MGLDTKIGEFDRFIDHLPEEIAESLWFIPVREDKAPDIPEEESLRDEEFRLGLEEARERLEDGKNIGIILRDHFSVLDVIDPEEAEEYLKDLPSTLEVSTRSGKVHRYYLPGDEIEGKDIPNIAELRTGWRCVVAPGSHACDEGGNGWGTYSIESSQDVAELSPNDLPPELTVVEEGGKEEDRIVNERGWRIEKIMEDDEKLDSLLTRNVPPGKGYVDIEEARKDTIRKLLYWEFGPKMVQEAMESYRKYEDFDFDSLFINVLQDFQSNGEDTISDHLDDPDAYRPGSGVGKKVKRKTRRELEEWVSNQNRRVREDGAVPATFASEIALPSGESIEEGSTLFLPPDLVAELQEKEKAGRYIFKCPRCHELHFQEKPYKPSVCQNPNCESNGERTDGKFLKPVHPSDHEERAEALMDNYHFKTVAASLSGTSAAGLTHLYEKGVYDEEEAMGFIRGKVQNMNSKLKLSDQNDVINYISVATQVSEEKFGVSEGKVVLEDRTLDLENDELRPHKPSDLATSKIPIEYDPDAWCPEFLDYLERMVPSEKDRERLQELLGTALVGEKLHKKGAMVVGPTDAGKSTLIKIIRGVFGGRDNVSTQAPSTLADTRWGKAKLRNKLLNSTDEVSAGRLEELATLKRVMDGDPVEAEEKREKTFEFSPTCEHLYAANQTPSASRKDDAFWNRWIVIETPNPVP